MTIRAELDNMRERVEAATEGPWVTDAAPDGSWYITPPGMRVDDIGEAGKCEDAEFIAHTRTDLPRLLEAIERVLAECEQMSTGSDTEAFCAERVRDAITTALEGK